MASNTFTTSKGYEFHLGKCIEVSQILNLAKEFICNVLLLPICL